MKKTIGIIGGMGPMATVDLMKKVILATDAREDQEHIPILVDNNTNIPDRTAAILGEGEDPLPELLKSEDRLTDAGADFLIMGCNTAHYFLPLMLPNLRIPVINMIEETAAFCARSFSSIVSTSRFCRKSAISVSGMSIARRYRMVLSGSNWRTL